MSADFLLARAVPTMPIYPYAMSVLVGIGLIVFLLIRRQRATFGSAPPSSSSTWSQC
jgi:flagellar biosynthesis protein FliR